MGILTMLCSLFGCSSAQTQGFKSLSVEEYANKVIRPNLVQAQLLYKYIDNNYDSSMLEEYLDDIINYIYNYFFCFGFYLNPLK